MISYTLLTAIYIFILCDNRYTQKISDFFLFINNGKKDII